jgi:predicted P-loop ATPase
MEKNSNFPQNLVKFEIKSPSPEEAFGKDIEQEIIGYPIDKMDLLFNGEHLSLCTENIRRILERHPEFKEKFRYDKWTRKKEIKDGDTWREVHDTDVIETQNRIAVLYHQFRRAPKQNVADAIEVRFQETAFDSAVDYITSQKWDGVERLTQWIPTVYHTDDDEYHQKVGKSWFMGMVKRVMRPGCKYDYMLVLVGDQGLKKSTSLEILGNNDWHVPTNVRIQSKDAILIMEGKMIVEFSEGSTMSLAENEELKSFLTIRTDKIRRPYARYAEDVKRRCVFAMTTNAHQFLKDDTGNRRYLPIEISEVIDTQWLIDNRDQLFAEAYKRVQDDECVWDIPFDVAEKKQMERLMDSPYQDMIDQWLKNPKIYDDDLKDMLVLNPTFNGITVSDVWVGALGGQKNRLTTREEMMIGRALKKLGGEKIRASVNGVQKMRWFFPEKSH